MIVLHLIRKNTQLKSPFIQNQITNHIDFEPHVAFYENRANTLLDGGFANALPDLIPVHSISGNNGLLDNFLYKTFKKLGKNPERNLLKVIEKIKPDIIHLHYATDAGIFLPYLKNINIPKVVSVYGYDASGFPRRFLGYGKVFLKNRTYKHASVIFAMSQYMKKDLLAYGCPENKIIVHYHGANVDRFHIDHDYNNSGTIKFLIISGLTPTKGHIFLLKAFSEALKINSNIRLLIVGDGPERKKIERYIKTKKMANYVEMRSFVIYGSDEHKQYFAGSDVFIHPCITDVNGHVEGIPGSIVEAMAAGLPIISTNHAGIPFIIENEKSGLLVNENDIDGLSMAILKLSENRDLRSELGTKARKFALENLNLFQKEKELELEYLNQILSPLRKVQNPPTP